MTDKEKAKAYDEALKKAKDMLSYKEVRQEDIEYLFPELKESENEKIRKEILDCFKAMKQQGCFPSKHKEQYDSWIAWLERQGEKDKLIQVGAGWMANQEKTFEGEIISEGIPPYKHLKAVAIVDDSYKHGDKVIIRIRKT